MEYVVAVLVLVPLIALVAGALAGRNQLGSCCAPADPRNELRMRAASEEDPVFWR